MKIKLITLTAALAMTAAMAQTEAESSDVMTTDEATQATETAAPEATQATETAAPEAPAPAAQPAPAPAAQTPMPDLKMNDSPAVANQEAPSVNFDVIRGRTYNRVGNQAAAGTISDNIGTPYKMGGVNLVYMEPVNAYAAVSFGTGLTKFLAFDDDQKLATLGIANKAFGVAFDFNLNKTWTSTEAKTAFDKTTDEVYTVNAGDLLRLTIAAPLGAIDIKAQGYWEDFLTSKDSTYEVKDSESKLKYENDRNNHEIGGLLQISNSPSGKTMFWSLGASVVRHETYTETEGSYKDADTSYSEKKEVTSQYSYLKATPYFNIGGNILQNKKSRVLLGLNTSAALTFYDDFKDKSDTNHLKKDSYSTISVGTSPNILAELALGNCWMIFAGASYYWNILTIESEEFDDDYGDEFDEVKYTASIFKTATYGTSVDAGVRFSYSNFALEASIENRFYNDPFVGFKNSDNEIIANLGAFINF